jgi:hypothetical protein
MLVPISIIISDSEFTAPLVLEPLVLLTPPLLLLTRMLVLESATFFVVRILRACVGWKRRNTPDVHVCVLEAVNQRCILRYDSNNLEISVHRGADQPTDDRVAVTTMFFATRDDRVSFPLECLKRRGVRFHGQYQVPIGALGLHSRV